MIIFKKRVKKNWVKLEKKNMTPKKEYFTIKSIKKEEESGFRHNVGEKVEQQMGEKNDRV